MLDISTDTATASATATVCESLATFGAAPERGELDSREVWDEDDAIAGARPRPSASWWTASPSTAHRWPTSASP